VGCGDGYLMNLVAPLCNRTIGIDYDFAATKLATKKLPQPIKCKVMQASSYQLPFYDEKFDIALLTDVIEHLEMPERCVKEIGRVLTPDGTLLLTTLNWRPDRKWDWRHIREYRPLELEALLRSFFSKVTLSFFWPLVWSKMYATKIGWKAIRLFARHFYNPFLRQGSNPRHFGQILAICQCPR